MLKNWVCYRTLLVHSLLTLQPQEIDVVMFFLNSSEFLLVLFWSELTWGEKRAVFFKKADLLSVELERDAGVILIRILDPILLVQERPVQYSRSMDWRKVFLRCTCFHLVSQFDDC